LPNCFAHFTIFDTWSTVRGNVTSAGDVRTLRFQTCETHATDEDDFTFRMDNCSVAINDAHWWEHARG